MSEKTDKILKWYREYPFRIEKGDDVSLVNPNHGNPKSKLSPLTDVVLNILTSDKTSASFIICYPSNTLNPIPLISYILADQNQKSVLVFSKNNAHYKNYYLLKIRYSRNWAYTKYPAGKISKGTINIELHAPKAKSAYKSYFKGRIPKIKNQFFDENYPKILFNQSNNIKFSDSITNLNLENEEIQTSKEKKLGIGNIIFENLDYFVYSKYKFESFANWIDEFRDKNHRFVFHISNPNYKLLSQLKKLFNAYVLYFPFSFIKANQDLKKSNKEYFKSLNISPERDVLSLLNIDSYEMYSQNKIDNILFNNSLKKGNIDIYFNRAIKLFEKINWKDVKTEVAPIIYKLKHLCFAVYKMFCIPREFGVKYYDNEQNRWSYPPLEYYLEIAYNLFKRHCVAPTFDYLVSILTYLSKMVFELSECKRYNEPVSYTRKAKNCALCEYLENNSSDNIIIGVQSGERTLVHEKVESIVNNGRVQVATLRQIAGSLKDFSESSLVLSGFLLPNQFQILFKPWKEIRFFVYKGKDHRWVKKQIKLIDRIDIEKEEQTFRYLVEIYRDMLDIPETQIKKINLFKNFIRKKRQYLKVEEEQEDNSNIADNSLSVLDTQVSLNSLTYIVRQIMKSNKIYSDIISAEKVKSVVKRYYEKSYQNQRLNENMESFKCVAKLENEISGEIQTIRLDVKKKYLYFNNTETVKIESHFPHSLREGQYIILFGKRKESISDFVKYAFGLEEDIDHDLITEWQGRLAEYYLTNFTTYKKFHTEFVENTPSTISSVQFNNWIKGNTNYTLEPLNFYYLGEFMRDEFFTINYKLICEEGKKIQKFNLKLSKKLKKLVVKVLNHTISRGECSPDELLLLDNIENCIFKIVNIQINK